jgi:hypothetical protein
MNGMASVPLGVEFFFSSALGLSHFLSNKYCPQEEKQEDAYPSAEIYKASNFIDTPSVVLFRHKGDSPLYV